MVQTRTPRSDGGAACEESRTEIPSLSEDSLGKAEGLQESCPVSQKAELYPHD